MTYKQTARRAGKTTTALQEAQRLINAQLRQIATQQKQIALLQSKLARADAPLNKARGHTTSAGARYEPDANGEMQAVSAAHVPLEQRRAWTDAEIAAAFGVPVKLLQPEKTK